MSSSAQPVTASDPLMPVAPCTGVSITPNAAVDVGAPCVIVNTCPPIRSVPERTAPVELKAYENDTVALPVPLTAEFTVIHESVVVIIQGQSAANAVSSTVPLPAFAVVDIDGVDRKNEQAVSANTRVPAH